MKGYYTGGNYYGLMPNGSWQRFESETAYIEVYQELTEGID